jgi:hypothetical protein
LGSGFWFYFNQHRQLVIVEVFTFLRRRT